MKARAHRIVLAAGVGISLAAHIAVGTVLYLTADVQPSFADNGFGSIELELAPEAPEAHTPGAETDQPPAPPEPTPPEPAQPEPAATDPDPGGTLVDDDPDDVGDDKLATTADAGVPDGGAAIAEASDAGAPDDGGAMVAEAGDAGVPDDAGTRVASGGSSGTDPAGDPDAPAAPTGADANLLAYFSQGERVGALVRLDRFRGTAWAARVEKIFQPMPDYAALMRGRKGLMADYFDSLILSSNEPSDATATTVICRYPPKRKPSSVRNFLDRPASRVRWRNSRGGALGTRLPSKAVVKNDKRVYLMPVPDLVFLVRPSLVGPLAGPAQGSMNAFPAEDTLPEWMRRVRTIEQESGETDGPEVLVTFENKKRKLSIPFVGSVVAPERVTMTLDIHKQGFVVRGNLMFASAKHAADFVTWTLEQQKTLTESYGGKLLLARVKAYNALKGLTLKQSGAKVAYATSISVADGQQLVDNAAGLVEQYFNQGAATPPPAGKPARRPRPKPVAPPTTPGDGPSP